MRKLRRKRASANLLAVRQLLLQNAASVPTLLILAGTAMHRCGERRTTMCSQLLYRNANVANQSGPFPKPIDGYTFDWTSHLYDSRLDCIRMGPWIFIPQPGLDIPLDRVEKNATLISGAHRHSAEWLYRTLDPGRRTYARGRVSRSDHKAVELTVWHRVVFGTADD